MRVEDVLQALRNADAAGDTEAATRLARTAKSMMASGRAPGPSIGDLPVDLTMGEAFSRGVRRGGRRLASTVTDTIPALAGAVFGADEYAARQMAEAAQKEQDMQEDIPAQFQSYRDVGGIGDAFKFAAETIGEQIPNLAATLVPALGGGTLAARGAATAASAVARKSAGQLAGAGLGSYALNAPEIFQNIYEETGQIEPAAALLAGTVASSLDSILPVAISRQLTGPMKAGVVEELLKRSGMQRGVARKAVAGVLGGTATEGVTEGMQEGVSIAAERFVDENPELFGSKEWDRLIESSIRGAVAGGGFSTVGGVAEGAREGRERRAALDARLEQRGRQLEQRAERDADRAVEDQLGGQMTLPGFERPTPPLDGEPPAPGAAPPAPSRRQLNLPLEDQPSGTPATVVEDVPEPTLRKKPEAPTPLNVSPTIGRITEETKDLRKALKIGPTAYLFRTGHPESILGKDIRDPLEAAEVMQILEDYLNKKPAKNAVEPVIQFLSRPEFAHVQGAGPTQAAPPATSTTQEAPTKPAEPVVRKKPEPPAPVAEVPRETPAKTAPTTPAVDPAMEPETQAQESVGAAPTAPVEETQELPRVPVGTPGSYVDQSAQSNRDEADRLGVTGDIEELFAQGFSPDEVYSRLRNDLLDVEPTDAEEFLTSVRDTLGIPAPTSKAGREEFQRWQEARGRVRGASEKPKVAKKTKATGATKSKEKKPKATEEVPAVEPAKAVEPPDAAKKTKATETPKGKATPKSEDKPKTTRPTKVKAAEKTETVETLEDESSDAYEGAVVAAPSRVERVFVGEVTRQAGDMAKSRAKDQEGDVSETTARILQALGLGEGMDPQQSKWLKKFKGSEAFSLLVMPQLIAAYTNVRSMGRSAESIVALMEKHGVDARDIDAMPARSRESVIAELNRRGRQQLDEQVREMLGLPKYYASAYQGRPLSAETKAAVEQGDTLAAIEGLQSANKSNKVLSMLLNKLHSTHNLPVIVVGSVPQGEVGAYDPNTNTVYLDAERGLNEATLVHELVHAAVSKALRSQSSKVAREFRSLYRALKPILGESYGGTNIQEFAAEAASNPEFQALLKDMKAPRGGSWFDRVVQAVAEFFGFRERDTAYQRANDLIRDIMDLTSGIQAAPGDVLFKRGDVDSSIGAAIAKLPMFAGNVADKTRDMTYNLKDYKWKRVAFDALRMDNIYQMFKEALPAVKGVMSAIEQRTGRYEVMEKRINKVFRDGLKAQDKHSSDMAKLNDIAIEARIKQIDLLDTTGQTALHRQFRSLAEPVRATFAAIRKDYSDALAAYRKHLDELPLSSQAKNELQREFTNLQGLVGYVPFFRNGDFWLEYKDPAGERVVRAFPSTIKRSEFVAQLPEASRKGRREFSKLEDVSYNQGPPPAGFIGDLLEEMKKNNATQAQLDFMWQSYLELFPASSIMRQMQKADNVAGMEKDLLQGYGNLMLKWSRKLINAEFDPVISQKFKEVAEQAAAAKTKGGGQDLTVQAAADSILARKDFVDNPSYHPITRALTSFSFFTFLGANVSSAVINATALVLMVLPSIGSRYGYPQATKAIMDAMKVAPMFGGPGDASWSKGKYSKLYETLTAHGQLEHTLAREVLEGARQSSTQYTGVGAKILDLMAKPFAAVEKYNRVVTAIAAYESALNGNPDMGIKKMSEADAIDYALTEIKKSHTSNMASTGPLWAQNSFGRVILTFKTFIWNSATVIAKSMYDSFKGEADTIDGLSKAQVRKMARRHVLGVYAISMGTLGVNGMPFLGAATTLANMLGSLFGDDDDPFDAEQELREVFGEMMFKGPVNYFTNLELSNRAGLANDLLWRDDPQSISEHGYIRTVLMGLTGPAGSWALGTERALQNINEGHVARGLEAMSPTALSGLFKSWRYMMEGATTLKGDPIDADISAWSVAMRALGFGPADLSYTYEQRAVAKTWESRVLERRRRLLNKYDIARTTRDTDMLKEVRQEVRDFSRAHPGVITQDTLERSYKARRAAEKELIHGLRFTKSLTPQVREKFFDEAY